MPIPKKLESYCKAFSEKLMSDSFPGEGFITGAQILNFSDIKQVNFLIIKNLLIEWRRQMQQMKSPYFDFENGEVRKALESYANTLSRHIKINPSDFEPLLAQSVKEAVSLMTSPYEFYMAFAEEARVKRYSEQELREIAKYIKHNEFIYTEFVNKAIESGLNVGKYKELMEDVFSNTNESPEDPDAHVESFGKVLPFEKGVFSDEPEVEEPQRESKPSLSEQTEEQAILNDSLKSESGKTIADIHHEQKIKDIRASLNLNQRFMFINGLFNGDEEKFNVTIDKIESFQSLEDAKAFLNGEFDWDFEQEEVDEFIDLISKRLA